VEEIYTELQQLTAKNSFQDVRGCVGGWLTRARQGAGARAPWGVRHCAPALTHCPGGCRSWEEVANNLRAAVKKLDKLLRRIKVLHTAARQRAKQRRPRNPFLAAPCPHLPAPHPTPPPAPRSARRQTMWSCTRAPWSTAAGCWRPSSISSC
jgi:hypothetical protein